MLAALLTSDQVSFGAAPPRRFGSGPLTRSVQNETDAAIDRAQYWLLARQAPDGSWGGSNLYLTAVCTLALSGDGGPSPATHQAGVARATGWLRTVPAPAPDTPAGVRADAWRTLALFFAAGATNAPADTLAAPPPAAFSNLLVELVLHEALTLGGTPPPEPPTMPESTAPVEILLRTVQRETSPALLRQPLAAVAEAWASPELRVWRESEAQRAWWLARTLNRHARGLLVRSDGRSLNWRRDLAGHWVNHQRIAPHGGGYWLSDTIPQIEETAFAILLLREL